MKYKIWEFGAGETILAVHGVGILGGLWKSCSLSKVVVIIYTVIKRMVFRQKERLDGAGKGQIELQNNSSCMWKRFVKVELER